MRIATRSTYRSRLIPLFIVVVMAAGDAPGAPAPADAVPADPVAAAADLRGRMGAWEEVHTGRRDGGDFDVSGFREALRRVASTKARDALPDLIFLLDNVESDEPFTDDLAVEALDALRDDRAVLPLLVKALPRGGGGEHRVIEAALRVGRPLSEQLLVALKSDDVVTKRRALAVIHAAARDEFNAKSRVKLSDAERELFAPSPEVRTQVEALCSDRDVFVRYDALAAHLLLNKGDASKVLPRFAAEKSRSVRLVLEAPELVTDGRFRGALEERARALVLGVPEPPPQPAAFTVVSPWVPYRNGLSQRVSMTTAEWVYDEPLPCGKPVWIRCELRNDGAVPANAAPVTSDVIFPFLSLTHPATERGREPISLPETYSRKDAGQGDEPGMLAPGATYAWRVRVVPPPLERNGTYTILRDFKADAAPALTLTVKGLPDPLWLTPHPRVGHDRKRIYFPRRPLPPSFLKPEPPRPPDEALRAPDAKGRLGGDGRRTVYMEKRAYEKNEWKYSSPLRPEALKHFAEYFELTYDAGDRLVKEVEFRDGRAAEWTDYDARGRIVLHGYFDRHGEVDRATGAVWGAWDVDRITYYGPKMAPAEQFVYAYDGQGRRKSEHRYDPKGQLTDYFVYDPPAARHGRTRYKRFRADGTLVGDGETVID